MNISDVTWQIFLWIQCKRDFNYHHLRKTWNPWMTIFPIYRNFEWKTCGFLLYFHVKLMKSFGLGVNRNSRHRTYSETSIREMLKFAFESEFSMHLNSLTHHYWTSSKYGKVLQSIFENLCKENTLENILYLENLSVILWSIKKTNPICGFFVW